ncbi:hypothetical protein M2323_001202 [Rhodoblastus acidophilus]|uniref:hypothetical protein n=1 Tax=Rhodoblastus acidophilus TaxID=1074 RepID=UPI002224D80F|nr:hypothetical protein [Rhodoblastus acidophilus]MCW2283384.1 hypothetical protein [Rhodoblastus acidophilus]MCW2332292.1 hypothetical protein [Rhodoblastus acidophilus]
MTTTYNLRASTNATFRWTRDFSALARVYGVAGSTLRMQARLTAFAADPPVYEWCSANISGGMARFDAATGLCVFSAPASDMAQMPPRLVYDCRLELTSGAIVPLFTGRLAFSQGVTRFASDLAATGQVPLGDTVAVDGETSETPTVLPVAMTAAVSAIQSSVQAAAASAAGAADRAAAAAQSAAAAAQSAAAAAQSGEAAAATSVTPTALTACFAALSPSQTAALAQLLIAALPDMSSGSVPVVGGQAFVDASGFLVRAV